MLTMKTWSFSPTTKVVGPVEAGLPRCMPTTPTTLRRRRSSAPLKQRTRCTVRTRRPCSPTTKVVGPVEARGSRSRPACAATSLRRRRSSAPLKLCLLARVARAPIALRRRRSSAPLKRERGDPRRRREHPLRRRRSSAPLKPHAERGVRQDQELSPTTKVVGPVEA